MFAFKRLNIVHDYCICIVIVVHIYLGGIIGPTMKIKHVFFPYVSAIILYLFILKLTYLPAII